MLINANAEKEKMPKVFACLICDFKCSKKSNYNMHLLTLKHQNANNANKKEAKNATPYMCDICNTVFKHVSSLSRHKRKHHVIIENDDDDIKMLTNLVLEVVKQNNELTNKIVDLSQQINTTTVTNNISNTSNINSNNKTFNLNVFLNETCKDAMNIMDFIDSIKLQLSDLESLGKLGYVEGITSIIVKNLKAMDVHKRPVHCSDSKREVMYVKHDNKWEKESEDKTKLRKLIKRVAHKNTGLLPQYKEKYPDCDTRLSEQYNKLIIEAMGGLDDNLKEKEDKIIHRIAKEVTIDKSNF